MSAIELIVADYLRQLAIDAASSIPRPDYSIGGQTVSRVAWREGLIKIIEELQKISQMLEPFELRGSNQ